jgi:hypothetical protein
MTVLETELEFFRQHKDEWLRYYKGKVALVKDQVLVGTFTTEKEAFSAGVQQFGNVSFLVKAIVEKEELVQFPSLAVGVISAHP